MLRNLLEQGLLFAPLAFALYLSYGLLKIADLTTDGSFLLGAAVFALTVQAGIHPGICMVYAAIAGGLAGFVVAKLQTVLGLPPLMAGILFVFILNTVSLKAMGRPNIGLSDAPSIFSIMPIDPLYTVFLIALGTGLIIIGLLVSPFGLIWKALGNNSSLLYLFGKSSGFYKTSALVLSNALTGFTGSLHAQANGFVDISMGNGIVLTILGTVILGDHIRKRSQSFFPFPEISSVICCLIGVVLYFIGVHTFLIMGLDPVYLKMVIGVGLIGFLASTGERKKGVFS